MEQLTIDTDLYNKLAEKYPLIKNIGINEFHSKFWLLMMLNLKPNLDVHEISRLSCQTLRKQLQTTGSIDYILNDLSGNNLILKKDKHAEYPAYFLHGNASIALQNLLEDVEKKYKTSMGSLPTLLRECDPDKFDNSFYESIQPFRKMFGPLMENLITKSATGTINYIIHYLQQA
jgi:hypothetical protein